MALTVSWSTVAADLWFMYVIVRFKRFWTTPAWCCYAVPRLAFNAIWALGLVAWLRIPLVAQLGASMRIAVTLEAVWLLLWLPGGKSGTGSRFKFAAMLGIGVGMLAYFLNQSVIGQVRIGCAAALLAVLLLAIVRPLDSLLMHQRHAAMMFVWLASAALASFEGVKSGEPGDAVALAVQAGCVVASSWIVKLG